MNKILITGATGNIGVEVIHYLSKFNSTCEIIAGVRSIEKSKTKFLNHSNLSFRLIDFEKSNTFDSALSEVDILFLLRPPQLSDVDLYFRPLCLSAKENGIRRIVFLSVQGAEKSKLIPHHKIENLIKEFGFKYIFIRPSYFMQNLTTSLLSEIIESRMITLPSSNAKFNWIDVKNIGEACAILLLNFEKNQNKSIEITGSENKSFAQVTKVMSEVLETTIHYKPVNPLSFYYKKRKEGLKKGHAIVMAILHFLPRLHPEPFISNNYSILTGKAPTTLQEFISREKHLFKRSKP